MCFVYVHVHNVQIWLVSCACAPVRGLVSNVINYVASVPGCARFNYAWAVNMKANGGCGPMVTRITYRGSQLAERKEMLSTAIFLTLLVVANAQSSEC